MTADEVLDSYVAAVARRLPLKRRADVAFELRGLLADELAERAASAGRPADEAMAVAMLRGYGSPADAAVRYYRPFTLVPPGDTPAFVVAVVAGGAAVSFAGLSIVWLLAWIGAVVCAYAIKGLILRHHPDAFAWRPRPVPDPDRASRVAGVAAITGWVALLAAYLLPLAFPDGPLGYSSSFTHPLRISGLVALIAAVLVPHVVAVARGRWTGGTRWARILITASIGVQIGWHVSYGDVFATADAVMLPLMAVASGVVLAIVGVQLYREWARVRPAPRVSLSA